MIKKTRMERAAAIKEERKLALRKRAKSEGKDEEYYAEETTELEDDGRPKPKIKRMPKSRLDS